MSQQTPYPQTYYPPKSEVPLNQPLYGATFSEAIKRFFTKYVVFTGRASLSEFWFAYLFNLLVSSGIFIFSNLVNLPSTPSWILLNIWSLATLIPWLAVGARRLHDANYSGLFLLLYLLPLFGWIVLLILFMMPTNPEGRQYDEGAKPTYGYPIMEEEVVQQRMYGSTDSNPVVEEVVEYQETDYPPTDFSPPSYR